MNSPFPGMDPFLEDPAFWSDFHSRFINAWCEAISDGLPAAYEASIGEKMYRVEYDPATRKLVYPDVAVAESVIPGASLARSTHGTTTLDPVTVPLVLLDGPREAYIEILHGPERNLVAVLELLSPGNKENPGWLEYMSKRNALLHQNVHLIELDLLVGGKRMPMAKPLPAGDYYYLLSRAEERPQCQVYSWQVDAPLPVLPVPLRAPDPDLHVNLAQVFATTYERGRYRRRVPYHKPCPAPLEAQKKAWAEEKGKERSGTSGE